MHAALRLAPAGGIVLRQRSSKSVNIILCKFSPMEEDEDGDLVVCRRLNNKSERSDTDDLVLSEVHLEAIRSNISPDGTLVTRFEIIQRDAILIRHHLATTLSAVGLQASGKEILLRRRMRRNVLKS